MTDFFPIENGMNCKVKPITPLHPRTPAYLAGRILDKPEVLF
jgi:hypothetical protein